MIGTIFPSTAGSSPSDPALLPDIWRASELAVSRVPTMSSGHLELDQELPNKGWPRSSLVELLLQQSGIGELQLLKPILKKLSRSRRIALIQPPYIPHAKALQGWGIEVDRLLWMRASSTGDALWTAEQILKNGSCGAVVLWQTNVRAESLRRLHLAAQAADTHFWLLRPMAGRTEASPAPLRLGLRPALGGISISMVKRRGPAAQEELFIRLPEMPVGRHPFKHDHAVPHQPIPTPAIARSAAPLLV
ncbi:hypothetical protein JAB5_27380 [Janthinobacterium sp. HH103]|uniref:translesion DNA synthesis-associated protein ImuA n=1 Tax=unclassified Janthinobacterium TaxID=2610881 RepID=UPI0008746B9B|nr:MULTISPECIES: translesion DNA synthesis-associated protein ImuA [unclassified Janthinobacterium]OEZ54665.1 hypothetical protein JAB2_53910 [Janthinobacterium sp. HH100]OEZ76429.1 hypothetical protein JAB5_27380 [Janthinobacterium sp. HH103]QOU76202.1 hypothetical protein JAB4_057020 [Janthinobacterium sp. HH102]